MKKSLLSLVLLLMISATASAVVICDANPPDWRGGINTTYQTWSFSTNASSMIYPDEVDNQYGMPWVDVIGDFSQGTVWDNMDQGHQGVWTINRMSPSEMQINIWNNPVQNEVKKVWLQITYSAHEGDHPAIYFLPEGVMGDYKEMVMIKKDQVDAYYWNAVYYLEFKPNVSFEQIVIRPRECVVYVDCVTIDTQCIPEPMTMVLLGLGSLILRRRSH